MRAVSSNTASHKAKRAPDWRFHEIEPPPGITGADYRLLNRERLCAAVVEFFARHRRRSHLAAIVHCDFGLPPYGDPMARPYLLIARKDAGSVCVSVTPAGGHLRAYYAEPVDDVTARDAFNRFAPGAWGRSVPLPVSRRRAAA